MPLKAHRWGISGSPPRLRCLRDWWWGDPLNGADLSLYDADGLTVARIIQVGDRYELISPISWPRRSWPDVDRAKSGAEQIALCAIPLDEKFATKIERENERLHPMGQPRGARNISSQRLFDASCKIEVSKTAEDPGPMPAFLRRAA